MLNLLLKMKKILLALFIIASSNIEAQPKKILFIGNSYTYVNNLPIVLYNLALSGGDTLIYSSSAPGGYTLQQHTTNATTLSQINLQKWDYVVIQEQSQKPAFSPSQVQAETYPYAAQLHDSILANDSCTEIIFYMTWGRKYGDASNCPFYPPICTFEGMQWRLRGSYVEMADDNEALVSPVGEAFKYSRMADSTINLYSTDNSHPSLEGTYLAACTFYATIYQTSPVGLSYTAGLTSTVASFLQQIAATTVLDSLSVWNINEFTPHAAFNYNQSATAPLQYQFTNASSNASNFLWYFGDGDSSTLSNPIHTFAAGGVYNISLTVSDGCESNTFQQTITISPTGNFLHENDASFTSVIFQNQNININFNQANTNKLNVTVMDAIGNIIYQKAVMQNTQIATEHWSKGVYFVKCTDGTQSITKKLSIQ